MQITSDKLIKKDGTDEPKAVLAIYEDFQCPHCRDFAKNFGPTLNKIAESGAAAVDYYMVGILDKTNKGTRRGPPTPPTASRTRTRKPSCVSTPRCSPSSRWRFGDRSG